MVLSTGVLNCFAMINTRELRLAIKAGDASQVAKIFQSASDPNVIWTKGWTPLHVAVKRGRKDVVAAILTAGVSINATTEMHLTALDVAVQHGHKPVIELLRKKGARHGAELSLHHAAAAGALKEVRKHIAAGADINKLVDEERPLGIALKYRHWDVAKYLLTKKCDVTKRQRWDATALHVAAACGAPEVLLAKLLKLGAEIDAIDDGLSTPLGNAAEAGHDEVVDWLLDHGADVARGRESDSTPVYRALYRDHVELASHLIDRGAKATLHQAVQCDHLARARQKLNAGADANKKEDSFGSEFPLNIAIGLDSTDMVSLLLEFGADPNQQDRAYHGSYGVGGGNTSLHEAVCVGSAKMVKLLLAHGADPDIGNAEGMTPIELARRKDHTHLANLMETHIDKQLSLAATQNGIEQLYPVQKVAELLSVDDAFILDLIKTRKITSLKLDEKTIRIPAGSIQRYLAKLGR